MKVGTLWRASVLIMAGALVYANSLSGPFILDDHGSIVGNEQIRHLWPPSTVLFPARETPVAGRPVVNVSFALNYAIGGLDVRGYHAVNITIHLLSALLLFAIVRRTLSLPRLVGRTLSGPPGGPDKARPTSDDQARQPNLESADMLALAASLIWMLHPLQTEAVNYVTQRTELLMAFFYLLTLYASIRAYERTAWQWLAILACALGMASKESMATAPILVVLFDRIFAFETLKQAWQARWRLYVGLAATWLVVAALLWSGPRLSSTGFSTGVSPWVYLLNQTVLIVKYLRLSIWPRSLIIDYGLPQPLSFADVWPDAGLLVALLAGTVVALKYRPRLGFLGAWFFVTLAPTSSILPIATWVGAERRMYLPLAAIVVLFVLAGFAVRPVSILWTRFWVAAVIVISLALATGTVLRNREYQSAVTLARTLLDRYPHARAHTWLGEELLADGRRDEAIAELRQGAAGYARAHYLLGMAMAQDGKPDEAVAELQQFVSKEPMLLEVVSARETMGRVLFREGKTAEAEGQFRELVRMRPADANAHGLLADALFKEGKFSEAISHYQEVLKAKPTFVDAITNLGISSIALDRIDEGVAYFRRAAEIEHSGATERNLARALLQKQAYQEAALHAQSAISLTPDDAVAHDELGVALAGLGRLDAAVLEFRRSLQLDPNDPEVRDHLAAALRAATGLARRP